MIVPWYFYLSQKISYMHKEQGRTVTITDPLLQKIKVDTYGVLCIVGGNTKYVN